MKRILYLLLALLPSLAMGETLSLDSCISLALQNNKKIQSSQKLAEKYEHEVKAYRANFFPNFKLVATDIYSNASGYYGEEMFTKVTSGVEQFLTGLTTLGHFDATNPYQMGALKQFGEGLSDLNKGIEFEFGNVFNVGLSLEQPLYMGGKVLTAYQMSKLGRELAKQGAHLSQNEVIVAVQEAYALVVRANEMHKVAVQYDSLLHSLLTDVQNAEKRGLRSHNDVLKVQVKLSEADLQVRQAENGQRLAAMNLCHYIGLPLTTSIEVDFDAFRYGPAMTFDLNDDITNRPEFSALDLKSQIAAKQVKLEQSEYLPQVVLAASYGYTDGIKLAGEKLFNEPTAGVMLNVSIPLYHANKGINKIKSARIEAERVRLEQEELVEKMNLELAQAANNLDEAAMEVALYEKTLEQTEDNLRSSRSCYNAGTESLSELLEAQTLWQQAYAKLANARANLFVAGTKYRKAAGKL